MNRNPLRVAFVAFALTAAFIAPSLAGLPAIFDRVPAEATIVLVTKNLDEVNTSVAQLLEASGLPPLGTPAALLERIGLNQAIDMTRPLAVALMPGDLNGDTPPAVIYLPTNDFAGMMDALDAEEDGDLQSFVVDTGETLFAREGAGGYAIVGPMRSTVAAIDGQGGNLASHESHIGAVGMSLFDDSDFCVVVKKPMLGLLEHYLDEQVANKIDDLDGDGDEQAEQFKQQAEQAAALLKALFNDTMDFVVGAQAEAEGLSFDMAVDFKPDSEFGEMFNSTGNSSNYLSKLPNQPFLVAYAGDYTIPAIGKMFDMFTSLNNNALLGGAVSNDMLKKIIDQANGQAIGVFVSPGGLLNGLLASTVSYTAAQDPNALLEVIRTMASQLDATPEVNMTYNRDAAQIDGVSVDRYSLSLNPAEDGNPLGGVMPQQALAMLFGAGGISGYYAPGKTGVYQTLSKNDGLLSAAMAAEDGQNPLTNDPLLAAVSKRMPTPRSFEAYFGIQSVVEQALQAMAIFGMQMDVDLPDQLPPIGIAATTAGSAARFSSFVPTPVIKTIAQLAFQAQDMMGGGDDFGDDDDPNDAPPF